MRSKPPWLAKQSQTTEPTKAMQAIDVLLADKPDEFRATVFELSRQLGWADDEPGFLLAIATNQLEALVKQYPERISTAMASAAQDLTADCQQLQTKLALSAIQSIDTAIQIDQKLMATRQLISDQLSETRRLLTAERTAMLQTMNEERAAMAEEREAVRRLLADERAAIAQQAAVLTEQQKQGLEQETKDLMTPGMAAGVERSDWQGQQVVTDGRGQHYWQALAGAWGSAFGLMCLTLLVQGQAQRYSEWGRFEQWNQNQLRDCRHVDSATCNFHIKPP